MTFVLPLVEWGEREREGSAWSDEGRKREERKGRERKIEEIGRNNKKL